MMQARAIVAKGTGGPEVLEPATIELPWPGGAADVLVRLKAAGVNPADGYFRALGPYIRSARPFVPGHDGAGLVEAVGPGVSRLRAGDAVCFCNGGIGGHPGSYAEFAVVPEEQLVRLPEGIGFVEAAALPLVFITAWEALRERAALKAGEHALVHGGAGGTGHVAIQLARLAGARVAATVSSEAKADFVARLGAERPILYGREDFAAAALAWTDGKGLEVALDNVGAETMRRSFRAMAPYGRLVTLMGTPADDEETSAYNRNLTIHNVMMLTPMWFGLREHLRRQAGIVAEGLALLGAGRLRLHVAETFPLSRAAAAQARLEGGGGMGKLVLAIPG